MWFWIFGLKIEVSLSVSSKNMYAIFFLNKWVARLQHATFVDMTWIWTALDKLSKWTNKYCLDMPVEEPKDSLFKRGIPFQALWKQEQVERRMIAETHENIFINCTWGTTSSPELLFPSRWCLWFRFLQFGKKGKKTHFWFSFLSSSFFYVRLPFRGHESSCLVFPNYE